MHDLIQLVILENMRRSDANQELFEFALELAYMAFKVIKKPWCPKWWPQCELLVPHIQALTEQQDTSIKAKKQLLLSNRRRGQYLTSTGRYIEARKLYERLIAEREQVFGPEDLDTLSVMHDLARVYRMRGRLNDAKTLFDRVLHSRKKHLGPEHRDTLMATYNIAVVCAEERRLHNAEALLKQTLQSQEK
jgi:tetratricopeptide (TPR) repeat protein